MSVTTSAGAANNADALGRIGEVEHIIEKVAHLAHELVDRVAHPTEADRVLLHSLVAEITGGIGRGQARDAVTDPAGYVEARDNGAYEVPEPVTPVDSAQARIAELEAELAAARATPPAPPMPAAPPAVPEADPATQARIAELEAQLAARPAAPPSAVPSTADSGHTATDVPGATQPDASTPDSTGQPAAGDATAGSGDVTPS